MDLSMWKPIVLFRSLLLTGTIGFHLIETVYEGTINKICGHGRLGQTVRERLETDINLFENTYIEEGM